MLLSFPGWCPSGSCKEEFTSGHSNPHPAMELNHTDRLFRGTQDLTAQVPIREKRPKDRGPSSPSRVHLSISRDAFANLWGLEATSRVLPRVWLVWPSLGFRVRVGASPG